MQSQYYDPVVGRFINADKLVDNSNLLGTNLFAYCLNNPVNAVDPTGDYATIRNGSTGEDVKIFQQYLNNQGYTGANGKKLSVDGIFGNNTEYAVKAYQRARRLAVDGVVGKNTWGTLDPTLAYNAKSQVKSASTRKKVVNKVVIPTAISTVVGAIVGGVKGAISGAAAGAAAGGIGAGPGALAGFGKGALMGGLAAGATTLLTSLLQIYFME